MKILRVIPTLDARKGGVAENARLLDGELISMGHSVVVLENSAPVRNLEYPTQVVACGPGFGNYGYNPALENWLQTNVQRFDAVILDGLWQYPGVAVRRACRRHQTPYFVFPHGMLDPWFQKAYPAKHLKKLLYWKTFERSVLKDAAALIFTCEEERRLASQSFGSPWPQSFVASLGTREPPPDRELLGEAFRDRFPRIQGKRILLFLGRLQEKKGCDLLLRAFSRARNDLGDFHLVMSGPESDSRWVGSLRALAAELHLEPAITWTGMLNSTEKASALMAADALCLPSHQENFGIVVAEALSFGKPVLITNKVNIWREVERHSAGIVDTDTVEGVERSLRRWARLSKEEVLQMSESALRCFETSFHIRAAAQQVIEAVESTLKSRSV